MKIKDFINEIQEQELVITRVLPYYDSYIVEAKRE